MVSGSLITSLPGISTSQAKLLLAIATVGISLVALPLLWWAGVAISAYGRLEDWHGKHHWLHPWTDQSARISDFRISDLLNSEIGAQPLTSS
jgi:hypothetical protein